MTVIVNQFNNDDVLAVTVANCIVVLLSVPSAIYGYFLTWQGSEFIVRGRYDLFQGLAREGFYVTFVLSLLVGSTYPSDRKTCLNAVTDDNNKDGVEDSLDNFHAAVIVCAVLLITFRLTVHRSLRASSCSSKMFLFQQHTTKRFVHRFMTSMTLGGTDGYWSSSSAIWSWTDSRYTGLGSRQSLCYIRSEHHGPSHRTCSRLSMVCGQEGQTSPGSLLEQGWTACTTVAMLHSLCQV